MQGGGNDDAVSAHDKTRYLVAVLYAGCLALAARYRVGGRYGVRSMDMDLHITDSWFVVKRKEPGIAALSVHSIFPTRIVFIIAR